MSKKEADFSHHDKPDPMVHVVPPLPAHSVPPHAPNLVLKPVLPIAKEPAPHWSRALAPPEAGPPIDLPTIIQKIEDAIAQARLKTLAGYFAAAKIIGELLSALIDSMPASNFGRSPQVQASNVDAKTIDELCQELEVCLKPHASSKEALGPVLAAVVMPRLITLLKRCLGF